MALESYPFETAGIETEAQWSRLFGMAQATGVDASPFGAADLAVGGSATNLTRVVAVGKAWVNGFLGRVLTSGQAVTFAANSSGQPRIDRVVMRAGLAANSCVPTVIQGTPAGTPTAPALVWNETSGVWDLPLAQVRINSGQGAIPDGNVTDERWFLSRPPVSYRSGCKPPVSYIGQRGYEIDTGTLTIANGTSWVRDLPPDTGWQSAAMTAGFAGGIYYKVAGNTGSVTLLTSRSGGFLGVASGSFGTLNVDTRPALTFSFTVFVANLPHCLGWVDPTDGAIRYSGLTINTGDTIRGSASWALARSVRPIL